MENLLSSICKTKFSWEEIPYCKNSVIERIVGKVTDKPFHHKEEIEECVLHHYDVNLLKSTLAGFSSHNQMFAQPYTLYRVVANKEMNYLLSIYYHDITSAENTKVKIPSIKQNVEEIKKAETPFLFSVSEENGCSSILIKSSNSSKNTLIKNILETFNKHEILPVYMDIWFIKTKDLQIKSLYIADCKLDTMLTRREAESLKNDFERYLHHYIKPMSIFDIVGPSMVGPSSSHTAGANRIGQISRNILMALAKEQEFTINSIAIKLLGSFRDTGPGHKTPSALAGGLWGLATDHPEMLSHGDPDFLAKNGIVFSAKKAFFAGFQKGTKDEEAFYAKDHNNNIAEIIAETEKGSITITGFSIGGGNVEIRYLNRETIVPITGKERLFVAEGKIITESESRKHYTPEAIQPIYHLSGKGKRKYILPFNTFEEFEEYVLKSEDSLIDIILTVEQNLQGNTREEILNQVKGYWAIMKNAIRNGIENREKSLLKLTGGDSSQIIDYLNKSPLYDNLFGRAIAYAVAVNEVNAKCGVIVACPTAGSCGLLPGVVASYAEIMKCEDNKIYESILLAGFLGMILFNDVTTAGADYGCQAEVGVGAAMAAAAITYLDGGNISQIIQAFILAIKNSLGLICDPVAGLVEVPCVKRNGIFASVAVGASLMARSGIKSFISPDEVILTMKEVGDKLHHDFKETASGGLAKTRDGKAVDRAFASEVSRFFGDDEL